MKKELEIILFKIDLVQLLEDSSIKEIAKTYNTDIDQVLEVLRIKMNPYSYSTIKTEVSRKKTKNTWEELKQSSIYKEVMSRKKTIGDVKQRTIIHDY